MPRKARKPDPEGASQPEPQPEPEASAWPGPGGWPRVVYHLADCLIVDLGFPPKLANRLANDLAIHLDRKVSQLDPNAWKE